MSMADHREEEPELHYEEGGKPDGRTEAQEQAIVEELEGIILEETIPTQILEPRQAMNRTLLQTLVPGLIVMVGILPIILAIVLEGMKEVLPPVAVAWLGGAVLVTTALSVTMSKIMALPIVNNWLVSHWPSMAASKIKE